MPGMEGRYDDMPPRCKLFQVEVEKLACLFTFLSFSFLPLPFEVEAIVEATGFGLGRRFARWHASARRSARVSISPVVLGEAVVGRMPECDIATILQPVGGWRNWCAVLGGAFGMPASLQRLEKRGRTAIYTAYLMAEVELRPSKHRKTK